MYKRATLIFFVGILVGCADTTKISVSTLEDKLMSEEYAVYDVLIEKKYIRNQIELIVIKDHTGLSRYAELGEQIQYVKRRIPDLAQDMLDNFQAKNGLPQALSTHFNLRVKYLLVNEKELNEIFQNPDGWSDFYRKYPRSQGLMALSRVGFNQESNQALVYVGNQAGLKAGAGYYVSLAKENGTWIIQHEVETWVS
jgi:hypothetical protein